MTGIVLALAGLMCADGGPGMGAATAPVALNPAINFGGRWVGTAQRGAEHPVTIEWDNTAGVLILSGAWRADATFKVSGPRAVTLTLEESVYRGTYAFAGDRLILRASVDGRSLVITLRPSAPHKP